MKTKLLVLLSVLLSSCSCILSQIPPQFIYAGSGCTAPIPDYKTQVTVTGGCTGFTVIQTPAPGTLLTTTNKTATIIIKATGTNGKSSQIQFGVSMLDTITPKITPTGSLVAYKLNQLNDVYNAGDKIVRSISGNVFPYYSKVGPDAIVNSTLKDVLIVISDKNNLSRLITYSDSTRVSMLLNRTK
jgi:hypothetical protein